MKTLSNGWRQGILRNNFYLQKIERLLFNTGLKVPESHVHMSKTDSLEWFPALQVRYSQRHYRSLQIFLFRFDDSRTGLLLFGGFFSLEHWAGKFPGGPVVKTPCFHCRG